MLRWYCWLETTEELPPEVDLETAQYITDMTEHKLQRDLQRTYGLSPGQTRQIISESLAIACEEYEVRKAASGYANEA